MTLGLSEDITNALLESISVSSRWPVHLASHEVECTPVTGLFPGYEAYMVTLLLLTVM